MIHVGSVTTRIGHDADDCLVYVALLLSAHSRDCGPRLIYMSPASPIAPDRGRVAHTLSSLALVYSVVSGEYAGAAWFIWMPIVILAVLAPTMWWLATKD